MDQCKWKEINFHMGSKDWKKFETNKKTITLNVLFLPSNSEGIVRNNIIMHFKKQFRA